jgi:hydrogenase maturation factor HypE
MAKDIKNEDFRIFVKLDSAEETLVNAGNQMILTLRSMGLIDDIKVANLFNRSTPDQVAKALRETAVNKIEISRVEAEQQAQQSEQMMQQMQAMQEEQNAKEQMYMAREDNSEELKHQRKLEQIFARSQASALAKQGQIPQQQG